MEHNINTKANTCISGFWAISVLPGALLCAMVSGKEIRVWHSFVWDFNWNWVIDKQWLGSQTSMGVIIAVSVISIRNGIL